jgi:predicted glycosyltransferase
MEILIPNALELHFEQVLLHGDRLKYDLGDVHTLTPQIKEDIKF